MIFVLTMLFTFVYDRKNRKSLIITDYSLLITQYSHYKHPLINVNFCVAPFSDGAFSKTDCSKPKYQVKVYYLKAEFTVNGEHSWLFQNTGS